MRARNGAFLFALAFGAIAQAQTIYQSNFQSGITTNWNTSAIDVDLAGRRTLGLFDNQSPTLLLPSVPAGHYVLRFDFFPIYTWDGLGLQCCGPDFFETRVNGETKINAAFVCFKYAKWRPDAMNQSYSETNPLGGTPVRGGTDAVRAFPFPLSYSNGGGPGSVPNIQFSPHLLVSHSGGPLQAEFIGHVTQPGSVYMGFRDEVWSLDNVKLAVPSAVSGNVLLQDFDASPATANVVFTVAKGGVETDEGIAKLDAGGDYTIYAAESGPFDLRIKGSHWLSHTLSGIANGSTHVAYSLINGDCDGDNEITLADYAMLAIAFGSDSSASPYSDETDLNGDDEVNLADYAILARNFGLAGD